MKKFKEHWEITKNWQLIFPFLGIVLSGLCGWLIAYRIVNSLDIGFNLYWFSLGLLTVILTYIIIKISLFCFKKLDGRWHVNARWEFITIFIVFAITGSTAGRISDPVMQTLGLGHNTISGWIYWPLRILLIFPIYQILLLLFAWLFGQFNFFYPFVKKMLSRMGLKFLFKN